jgi:hypothetical protein
MSQVYFLENPNQIPPNSIKFQILEHPYFLIQIVSWILRSSNKKSCPSFNFLQIHILLEIFGASEDIFWTISNLNQLIFFE